MRKQNPASECFVCDSCGNNFDVPACRGHSEIIIVDTEKNSVKMYDICANCSKAVQVILEAEKKPQPPADALEDGGSATQHGEVTAH
jgi:aspartate-semialdehyde dehydrogenase